ncbi:hypothetical protein L1887_45345 [Cichorium endivia]|nr:hypothetical protein L1887_45345 [Cichorium endivia]
MGVRAQQKEKTRRSLVEAAFSQLSAERSFASLSLREVAREAGIAPTSFYRHFRDVDELGLTMVDESGLMLRQLMRQARQRIAKGGSVIRTSVSTFMEFIGNNPNAFRLLLRERSGTSAAFRAAVAREIQHFIAELADYLELENHMPRAFTEAQAEAMVTIVFSAGAEALDVSIEQRKQLEERLVLQLRMISKGAYYWYRREQEKLAHQTEDSIVPFSIFPLIALVLTVYCLHQRYLNRTMPVGLPGLAAACFILGVLLYSTVVRAEYPDIGSNFFPAVLSVALVFWIGSRMRSRKSQLPE